MSGGSSDCSRSSSTALTSGGQIPPIGAARGRGLAAHPCRVGESGVRWPRRSPTAACRSDVLGHRPRAGPPHGRGTDVRLAYIRWARDRGRYGLSAQKRRSHEGDRRTARSPSAVEPGRPALAASFGPATARTVELPEVEIVPFPPRAPSVAFLLRRARENARRAPVTAMLVDRRDSGGLSRRDGKPAAARLASRVSQIHSATKRPGRVALASVPAFVAYGRAIPRKLDRSSLGRSVRRLEGPAGGGTDGADTDSGS